MVDAVPRASEEGGNKEMTDRDRLIELLMKTDYALDTNGRKASDSAEFIADYLLANGVIVPPCKVGDKVAVRACCECVATIPDNDECRNICPFEDDCECDACDNANERIFNTEISSIFNDGFGWKITFKHLSLIEANFNDIGTSFFVGENAEQQAKEYEAKLKELSDNG